MNHLSPSRTTAVRENGPVTNSSPVLPDRGIPRGAGADCSAEPTAREIAEELAAVVGSAEQA